ncbi:hypothetical protein GALL_499270 [mine drainage metagenome]|uniref:Uncharacterized protein n=1 Tax=mine drainage metagenome TaxID=410659 RepID=A0A1J5PCJ7_9ZZZZ
MARQGADAVKLLVQLGNFSLGCLGLLLQAVQFVTGRLAVVRHVAGGSYHFFEHRRDIGNGFGLFNQPGADFQLRMKVAGGGRHGGQALDKSRQHLAHFFLRLHGAGFGLGLLEDDIFQTLFNIIEPAQRQWRYTDRHQRVHLAFQPVVIQTQVADVFNHQMQQLEQYGLYFGLVFGGKRQPVTVLGDLFFECNGIGIRVAQSFDQRLGLLQKTLVVMPQRRQGEFDHAGNLAKKITRQGRCSHPRHHDIGFDANHQRGRLGAITQRHSGRLGRLCHSRTETAISHQRRLDTFPVELVHGRFEQPALLLLPRRFGWQGHNNVTQTLSRERRLKWNTGNLAVNPLVVQWGRRQFMRRQVFQRLTCNFERCFFSHDLPCHKFRCYLRSTPVSL